MTESDEYEPSLSSVVSEDSFISDFDDFEFEIDFDDAHNEWTANKRRGPNGTYVYICGKSLNSGKICQHACCDKIGLYSGCKRHYMWEEKAHKLDLPE